ncbi:quinone-dependent dihydroorotate dehydrogenase [Rhodomicrobium lacus]|uniref:quinone-dependent dihydroorotate dehydrogenase n=1 Tax=Rhodomicrobium lacus TaxID=2498452 RepID=UPI0026E22125|nr:quinone-dependent dihydroorotate dehydrogenase [Rhodomicrobium lacus]WKW49336.1 quinone-dependent dihydroorotate dehydrogenase [Rhodomicrobium lacus]
MSLWRAAQAGLFLLDPETAHEASLRALEAGVHPRQQQPDDPRLAVDLFGLRFPNPVGVAAGYDKDARVYNPLFAMGFGFVEAGTITPEPQPGNPRPRSFRLIADRGVINRFGFNSEGHGAALRRLASHPPRGLLGVNIGANKTSEDRIADYVAGVAAFGPIAAYLTINISSPNTPGLRDLQAPDQLAALLDAVMGAREKLARAVPVLVKLAPDLHEDDIAPTMRCLLDHGVGGAILTNTTLSRDGLTDRRRGEVGGLSGRPLFARSTRFLARCFIETGGRLPLIGVGGIDSGETAVAKIRAGASLVQLYTGLIYEGAGLLPAIKAALLTETGALGGSLAALVGADAEKWAA